MERAGRSKELRRTRIAALTTAAATAAVTLLSTPANATSTYRLDIIRNPSNPLLNTVWVDYLW